MLPDYLEIPAIPDSPERLGWPVGQVRQEALVVQVWRVEQDLPDPPARLERPDRTVAPEYPAGRESVETPDLPDAMAWLARRALTERREWLEWSAVVEMLEATVFQVRLE